MATIRRRGPGGGKKVNRKRVSRSWMIKTILAQQAQLDQFSQELAKLKLLTGADNFKVEAVSDDTEAKSMPEGRALAPTSITEDNKHAEIAL